jgi:hypothetical protein
MAMTAIDLIADDRLLVEARAEFAAAAAAR